MFKEISDNYNGNLKEFMPYAKADNRDAWDKIDNQFKEEALKLADSYLGYSFPNMLASEFMEFTLTGNRTNYENKLFEKRQALNALVLGECIEYKGKYINDIVNGIISICEESAWQLPAHNVYIRDAKQYILPDSERPVVDLFAAEAGSILATVSYLLEDKLNEISPVIVQRIRYELKKRVIKPYLNYHFWWMGNGDEPMCNWTVWCTQNVLLTAFLGFKLSADGTEDEEYISQELLRTIVDKACYSTDCFLKDYGDDGCCDEGAQYYRHAGLCLFNAMEVLNTVCDGAFSELYVNEKIRNIASYIYKVHVSDKYYVNFADCSPVAGRAGSREYLFAKKIGNKEMMKFASSDYMAGGKATLLLSEENNLFYRLQNGFVAKEIKEYATAHKVEKLKHEDVYYKSVGLFIAHDDSLCLAVKAGNNGDSHNHNDTGSFTVYKNGQPLLIDVGVESYTKKTFSKDRYDIWTMQSAYHNLPTIGGIMQKDGREYGADEVASYFNEEESGICMNISGAYEKTAGLKKYYRKFKLIKGDKIVIEDSFETDKEVVLSLMTYEKPEVIDSDNNEESENSIISIGVGELGKISARGAKLKQIEMIPIDDARLKKAWEHEIYRIQLVLNSKVNIEIE